MCLQGLAAHLPPDNFAAQHNGLGPERSMFLRCNKVPDGDATQPLHELLMICSYSVSKEIDPYSVIGATGKPSGRRALWTILLVISTR